MFKAIAACALLLFALGLYVVDPFGLTLPEREPLPPARLVDTVEGDHEVTFSISGGTQPGLAAMLLQHELDRWVLRHPDHTGGHPWKVTMTVLP